MAGRLLRLFFFRLRNDKANPEALSVSSQFRYRPRQSAEAVMVRSLVIVHTPVTSEGQSRPA
jgi:hypothetical protein